MKQILTDLTALAAVVLTMAVIIGWIIVLTPMAESMDADGGYAPDPAPLTALIEGGRV